MIKKIKILILLIPFPHEVNIYLFLTDNLNNIYNFFIKNYINLISKIIIFK